MTAMVQMRIQGVTIDVSRQSMVVWLTTPNDEVTLPVAIHGAEILPIYASVAHRNPAPALPNDFLETILNRFHARVNEVRIVSHLDTISTDIVLMAQEVETTLRVRPSDAIAMAVRFEAPVSVSEEILAEAGFVGIRAVIGSVEAKPKRETQAAPSSDASVEIAIGELLRELDYPELEGDFGSFDHLKVLRKDLQMAIVREDYEEAGRIKTKIEAAEKK